MKRWLGVLAGSMLASAAVAGLLLGLRGQTPDDAIRDGEPKAARSQPRKRDGERPTSVPSVLLENTKALEHNDRGPTAIVDTLETSHDPRAIRAALGAVLTTYSSRSTRKPTPDRAVEQAIARHVGSGDGVTVRAALAAARVPLMSEAPGAELVNAIAAVSGPEQAPARRTLALEALNLLRPDRRGVAVLSAIERALSAAEPEVLSQALFALAQSGPSLTTLPQANRADLGERVQALARHPNPGVRGRALFALAELSDLVAADVRLEAALRLLADPEPYVRAEAANLAGRCGEPRAIHDLMDHVGDLATARYDLAFVDVEGRTSLAQHGVPGRKRVAEAVLFSILALSRNLPVASRFELTLGGRAESDALLLENTAIVRAWYREVAAEIPR